MAFVRRKFRCPTLTRVEIDEETVAGGTRASLALAHSAQPQQRGEQIEMLLAQFHVSVTS